MVKDQPHRLGNTSVRRASAVGRLIEDAGHLTEGYSLTGLYEAAKRFEAVYHRWRISINAPRPFGNSSGFSSHELTALEAKICEDQYAASNRVLAHCGERQTKAVGYVVLDEQPEDWRPPAWIRISCIEGLIALAGHYGLDIDGEDEIHKDGLKAA